MKKIEVITYESIANKIKQEHKKLKALTNQFELIDLKSKDLREDVRVLWLKLSELLPKKDISLIHKGIIELTAQCSKLILVIESVERLFINYIKENYDC